MHRQTETDQPRRINGATLEQHLRYTDLALIETIRDAERDLIARGEIGARKPFGNAMPSPRGKKIAARAKLLLVEAMQREGLPMSLLGDGKTGSQRNQEFVDSLFKGPALSSFQDTVPGARHPLQSTAGMGIAA